MVTPQSDIRLIKVPFELNNENQLTFSTIEAQTEYFLSLDSVIEDNATYQRKDNVIRFPSHIDNIINYNYVMYRNDNVSNNWFYAFITDMKYLNDNVTLITIKTDVFQTWQFLINYNRMFVEREHVSSDLIGEHTITENLDTGKYICESNIRDAGLSDYFYIIVASNYKPKDNSTGLEIPESSRGESYSGISYFTKNVFGTQLYIFDSTDTDYLSYLFQFIKRVCDYDGHPDSIEHIFIVPHSLILARQLEQHLAYMGNSETPFKFYELSEYSSEPAKTTMNITKLYQFSDYTPKNNKCFVYPYNYLFITNNSGNSNIYKYEDFSGNTADFETALTLSIGCSGRVTPKNYKGQAYNHDEDLILGKYPTCSWSSDSFINWLTQNAVNIGSSIGLGVGGLVLSGLTGGSEDGVSAKAGVSGGTNIINTIGSFRQASMLPNKEVGQNTGDVNFANLLNTFNYKSMRVQTEYLKIIDDFFTMYGYKVNSLKIPNITGRLNWNYVKTIGCNITGDIPQEDLQEIKDMFNRGVTFWHNPLTFLDYSQTNSII